MSTETKFKEIDGHKYACMMMPATKSQRIFIELTQLMGHPAVAMISNAFQPKEKGAELHVEELMATGVRVMLSELDPDTSDRIIKTVFDGVKLEGVGNLDEPATFDAHFRGRVMSIYKVFAWAMEVNYQDFFDAARSSPLGAIWSAVKQKGLSGLTATLSSGESSEDQTAPST